MARTRYYKYVFSDNSIHFFTPEEAQEYISKCSSIYLVFDGFEEYIKDPPRIKDGFKPGWQPGLGIEVNSYGEYKKICKQKGYEIGGNDRPTPPKKEQKSKIVNDSILKDLVQRGAQISGNEAEALKRGEKLHK